MRRAVLAGLMATIALPSISAYASTEKHYPLLDTLADEAFFKDTKLSLTAKNHWKYLKEDEDGKKVHQAWGQSFGFDYESGYLFDLIGVDASFISAIKLADSKYFASRALLYNDNGEAKGYNKFAQRYLKLKLGNDQIKFKGKVGYQILKNYGVVTASNQLTKNSWLGYSGTTKMGDLTLDLAYLTHSINRDSPDKVNIKSRDGAYVIDYIYTGGLTYKDKDTYISYGYGYADDYLRRHVIEASYKPNSNLTFATQIYGSYALDNYKNMRANKKEFDNHAWHYAFDTQWREQDWSLKGGIAYTKAELDGQIGVYGRHLGKNTRGRFNAITSAGKDYMRDGELALTAVGTYNFIEELTSGVQLNYGQFDYKDNTVRTGEVALFNIWQPADPRLKNLSIFSQFGYGLSYVNKNNTPTLTANGNYQRAHSLSGEITITYKFGIL
ncbi:hypothetical protein RCS94_07240 [Orbaceae bacterium ac157xtp]